VTGKRIDPTGTEPAVDRREFLALAATLAGAFALPASAIPALAGAMAGAARPPVVWLSFQECTGCTESLTRAFAPTLEDLVFDFLSLDYHHTLQAASGEAAEAARLDTMARHAGAYLVVVEGSVPTGADGAFSAIAGQSNLAMLAETVAGAAAVLAAGSCSSFGGIASARPNPTGAMGVGELMAAGLVPERPLVNLPGCPPMPLALAGTLAYRLAFDALPPLDDKKRPFAFYGATVHEGCDRYHFFVEGKFAESPDDDGARNGWCLYKLGCRGPVTHNACARFKWNGGVSFPVESGHPCIGCSEPGFWDGGGFYEKLSEEALAAAETGETGPEAAGRTLYEDNCVYCHAADPTALATEPEAVARLLAEGSIRAHSRFGFTPAELSDLTAYLEAKAKAP